MTLNGVIALILRYFVEFNGFGANYITVVEDRSTLSTDRLPLLAKTDPPCGVLSFYIS